ncbi:matrix metalloproteinase-9-like [Eublepharis macularius]|uniref:Matrix metalloproteinase-9-like n=1 Tax=Eublepharis macularius TaxID=481883 RepID=A0AA97K719_EUBMA|nr:matrix metalloproteinase-9-like [Eublepharis macularius]
MESPPCIFPFVYKGRSYQSCTTDGWSDGKFWCATTNNYDADKKWKFCQVSGPDPDIESPPCIFPFIYKGKSYSTCTTEGMSDGTHWCATTSTYDVDKKWVYCNVTGPDTSKEGPTCVFPFIYNGMNYSSCTEDGRTDGKLWCATTRNFDADKRWTFCTITKLDCVFPFVFRGKTYHSCTTSGHLDRKLWCPLTSNPETDRKWLLCADSGITQRVD